MILIPLTIDGIIFGCMFLIHWILSGVPYFGIFPTSFFTTFLPNYVKITMSGHSFCSGLVTEVYIAINLFQIMTICLSWILSVETDAYTNCLTL